MTGLTLDLVAEHAKSDEQPDTIACGLGARAALLPWQLAATSSGVHSFDRCSHYGKARRGEGRQREPRGASNEGCEQRRGANGNPGETTFQSSAAAR